MIAPDKEVASMNLIVRELQSFTDDQRRRALEYLIDRYPPRQAEPDLEAIAARVHETWMSFKRAEGVTSRRSERNEELMVPYDQLSEQAKDIDRATAQTAIDLLR